MYGLVLEGGGARGAYEIGVWKALRELGIEIKGVSGTSVGALNGAMIVQNDFEIAYKLWYDMTPSKVIGVDDDFIDKIKSLDITSDSIQYLIKKLKLIFTDKGIDIEPLKELLRENIKENIIRKSGKDFGIVTICLTDKKVCELFLEDIPEGMLINYLLASSNLPVFKQERFDGKLFLDGGFYDNLPIKLLVSKGYKDLIVVKLNSIGNKIPKVDKSDLNITYIEPVEDIGRILDFSQDNIRKNIKLGYFDTLKVFKKLKGTKYYIEPKNDEDYALDYFMSLDKDVVLKIGKILGIEDMNYRRMLFECIIPKLSDLLEVHKNGNYEDIIIALYEEAALRYEIERFNIYNFDDFIDIVIENFSPSGENVSSRIPKILKHSDLLLKTFRKDILNEVIDELLGILHG